MKNLIIIGGSGFIGKSFIDGFNKGLLKKFKIKTLTIICRNPNKIIKNKSLNLKKIKLIKGDITNIKRLPKSNLFIYASEPANIKIYSKKLVKKYSKAILNFIKLIKNIKNPKILYISSGAVNGKLNNKKNYSNYSVLKKFSESEILKLANLGLKVSIARCYSFIGRWLPLNQHYAIGNFIFDGLMRKYINIKSSSKVYRSYMFSDDLVIWLTKILINSNINCPTYNVGSDEKIEIKKLAKIIANLFDKPIKQKKINRLKKIDTYVPDISKTKKKLNLKITYNLKDAILSTIRRINE